MARKKKPKLDPREKIKAKTIAAAKAKQRKNHEHLGIIQLKNSLVTGVVKGRYYKERCNMMVAQLNGKILETADGVPKTREYLVAEHDMTKLSAVQLFRQAAWDRKELDDMKVSEKEIEEAFEEYLQKPMVRKVEDYDDGFRKDLGAKFVPVEED